MKLEISLPDDLIEAIEREALRSGLSEDEVFFAAVSEYLARHSPDQITAAINSVVEEVGEAAEEEIRFLNAAASHVLRRVEW